MYPFLNRQRYLLRDGLAYNTQFSRLYRLKLLVDFLGLDAEPPLNC